VAGKSAGGDGVLDSDAIVLSANEVGRVVRFCMLFIQRGRDANCEGSLSRDNFLF
jgi:hypothetical protein